MNDPLRPPGPTPPTVCLGLTQPVDVDWLAAGPFAALAQRLHLHQVAVVAGRQLEVRCRLVGAHAGDVIVAAALQQHLRERERETASSTADQLRTGWHRIWTHQVAGDL